MSIYQEIILDLYRNPHNFGELEGADKKNTLNNPLCGDVINMFVKTDEGMVKDVKFNGKGCAISMAAASLLTDYVKGKSVESIQKLDASIIHELLQIELSPTRLKCALLPLEALQKVLK